MTTKITIKGQITVPKHVRDALGLSPGDSVEFAAVSPEEFVVRKAQPPCREPKPRRRGQMRRRAAELLELLRRLD